VRQAIAPKIAQGNIEPLGRSEQHALSLQQTKALFGDSIDSMNAEASELLRMVVRFNLGTSDAIASEQPAPLRSTFRAAPIPPALAAQRRLGSAALRARA
jgi:hypothetical protein